MLNLLRNSINAIKKVSGLDSDASAFITAAGLTDATQKDAINTLVKDMKASGLWSKMKAVYPMVGGTATSMKFNLKDPRDLDAAFRLTWSGGWTYSATGATPNGTNAYADTKLIPSSVLNQDSTHISYYSRTNSNGNEVEMGTYAAAYIYGTELDINRNSQTTLTINSNSSVSVRPGNIQSVGFFNGIRTANNILKLFKNGTSIGSNTTTATTALSTFSIYLASINSFGTSGPYSTKQVAFSSIGDGLSDTEASTLYTIIQAYQTRLSRQV